MKKERILIDGWSYYNHAAIPTSAPHEHPNIEPINDGTIWNIKGGKPLFARYCTNWDYGNETDWWYVIKDSPFDITELKSKRRYEINKGIKNFDVKIINLLEYKEEIYEITKEAYNAWPIKYRPQINKNDFLKRIESSSKICFGAFDKKQNKICGYALLSEYKEYADFSTLRVKSNYEKDGINFALVYGIVEYYNSKLSSKFYICDGSRAILHETAFQDYLEKYFGFRKAYCKLMVKYRFPFGFLVFILKKMKWILKISNKLGNKINAVLFMDDIAEKCKKVN